MKDEVCATSREKIDRERREGKRGEERRWGRGKRGKEGGYLARSKRSITGTSLVAEQLRVCTPTAEGPGLIPGRGTGSHMLQ